MMSDGSYPLLNEKIRNLTLVVVDEVYNFITIEQLGKVISLINDFV